MNTKCQKSIVKKPPVTPNQALTFFPLRASPWLGDGLPALDVRVLCLLQQRRAAPTAQ